MARAVAESLDYPDARVVPVKHPIGGIDDATLAEKINAVVDGLVSALLDGASTTS